MNAQSCLKSIAIAAALALPAAAFGEKLGSAPEPTPGVYHPERARAMPKSKPDNKPFAEHFIVYQVSRDDKVSQVLPLNNASNTLAAYGPDAVAVEVVAFGPGMKLLTKQSPHAERVESLAKEGVVFSACANTMKNLGIPAEDLTPGVVIVGSGVVRINQLDEAGWTYIRP